MALRIRLRRMGRKKAPHYRIVVAESSMPRDGRFVQGLGHYNPRSEPVTLVVDRDRAREWMSKGAKPTETVQSLFRRAGVFDSDATGVFGRETQPGRMAARAAEAAAAVGGAAVDAAKAAAETIAGAAAPVVDAVSEAASSAAETVSETAAAAAETASDAAEAVADAASDAAERVATAATGEGEATPAEAAEASAEEGDERPA